MELQVADIRAPFEVAFSALPRRDALPEKLQDDLAALVAELARKYFGISSEVMVEGALRGAVALVNEGILLAAGSGESSDAWPPVLREKNILALCSAATGRIKKIAQAEASEYEPEAEVARRVLWEFFRQNEIGGWRAAHRFLEAGEEAAQRELLSRDLAAWLEKNTTVGRVVRMKRLENHSETSMPDEIINYIVPRCCGIAAQYLDAFQVAEVLSESDEPPEDFQFGASIVLPARIFTSARKKYAEFAAGIPARLQPALCHDGQTWFERFVSTAPAKKKKTSESEEPESDVELDSESDD
jgi:hypothetical protein